jgi:hypothetical protein
VSRHTLISQTPGYHCSTDLVFCVSFHFFQKKLKYTEQSYNFAFIHGCETWSVPLREQHRLRVFETGVLRKISGVTRDEARGKWRKLQNKQFYTLYSSPNVVRVIKSRIMSWAGRVARRETGEVRAGFW